MTKIQAMDEFVTRSLRTFLATWSEAYVKETLDGELAPVGLVQARYEIANIAIWVIAEFVSQSKELSPEWKEAIATAHDLICRTGDDLLRKQGIDPSVL